MKRLVNKISNENKSKKEYVCVTERERVCVCERERGREREIEGGREKERGRNCEKEREFYLHHMCFVFCAGQD